MPAFDPRDRREVRDAKGNAGYGGGGTRGGGGFGSGSGNQVAAVQGQMHKNRQAQIAQTAKKTGTGTTQIGNSGRTEGGLVHDTFAGMGRDYRNDGAGIGDSIANRIASLLGFNEQRPTMQTAVDRVRGTANPTQNGLDNRAGWGFDPAGLIGGGLGMAAGLPFGGGFIADMISSQMGRPLEIGMGPSVFGGGFNMPSFGGGQSSGGVQTASGVGGFGGQAAGGGTGNGNFGYTPFRTGHTTGNPNVTKPVVSIPQQITQQQQPQNLWAKPWPSQQQNNYSPFGHGSWTGWG